MKNPASFQMVMAIKPLLVFSEDVALVLGTGRTTTFAIAKNDVDFPPKITVGRRQFMKTDRFMAWLSSKEFEAVA